MKKVVLLLLAIFLLCGCGKKEIFYLDDKYYNNGDYISVTSEKIDNNGSYLLYTYNNFLIIII